MKIQISILSVLVLVSFCSAEYLGKIGEFHSFKIDLNDLPSERFLEPSVMLKNEIKDFMDTFLPYTKDSMKILFRTFYQIIEFLQPEYTTEIKSIAKAAEVDYLELLRLNYFVEYISFCTSFIARDKDGTLFIQRHIDYWNPDVSRNNAYLAKVYKGDKYLYDAVMHGGLVGVHTGMKNNSFALSYNQRYTDKSTIDYVTNVMLIFSGVKSASWNLREILIECEDYNCAQERVKQIKSTLPFYLALVGVTDNEGAVFSSNRFGQADIQYLSQDKQYVFQTNEDHFVGDCNDRCGLGREILMKINEKDITPEIIKNELMMKFPVLNKWGVYHTYMVPSKGIFENIGLHDDTPIQNY